MTSINFTCDLGITAVASVRYFSPKPRSVAPDDCDLFTFQRNERARAFYEAHGFRIVNLSDGSRNEEGEPDVLVRMAG